MQDSLSFELTQALVLFAHGALIGASFLSFALAGSSGSSFRLIFLSWISFGYGGVATALNAAIQQKRSREYKINSELEIPRKAFFQYKYHTWVSVILKFACVVANLVIATGIATYDGAVGAAGAVCAVAIIASIVTAVAIVMELRRLYGPIRREEQIYLDVERSQEVPDYTDDEETLYTDDGETLYTGEQE